MKLKNIIIGSLAALAVLVGIYSYDTPSNAQVGLAQKTNQIEVSANSGADTPVSFSETVKTTNYSNTVKTAPQPSHAPNGTYTNTAGNEVPRPYIAPTRPAGASAQCRDGSYSFSQSRRGTCSHHGGVATWF